LLDALACDVFEAPLGADGGRKGVEVGGASLVERDAGNLGMMSEEESEEPAEPLIDRESGRCASGGILVAVILPLRFAPAPLVASARTASARTGSGLRLAWAPWVPVSA
jgi:hypothetical protein